MLLLAFGGPRSPSEVKGFLQVVSHGRAVSPARLVEVAAHYEAIGGRSPLAELIYRQARALERRLARGGGWRPAYVGMRCWHPFIGDTMRNMAEEGIREALAVVLSPHRTEASYDRYVREVQACQRSLGVRAPRVEFAPPWHAHPLFIAAQVQCVQEALARLRATGEADAAIVFTAHSVPEEMARASGYCEQVEESARLVAERLAHERWLVAYQSRSGQPSQRWLGPDVCDVLRGRLAREASAVVVVPIGFVCDHVEVLFDLDIEARKVARGVGLRFERAPALNDRAGFIDMLAAVVEHTTSGRGG